MLVKRVRDVKLPTRGTNKSAGIDFYVPTNGNIYDPQGLYILNPSESVVIPSGIKARIPKGMALIAFNKSGVATKKGLQVGACVVDEDYTGEIHIHLTNTSIEQVTIEPKEKIVQFLLVPVSLQGIKEVESEQDLYYDLETQRGDGKFGSTGKY